MRSNSEDQGVARTTLMMPGGKQDRREPHVMSTTTYGDAWPWLMAHASARIKEEAGMRRTTTDEV